MYKGHLKSFFPWFENTADLKGSKKLYTVTSFSDQDGVRIGNWIY
jgi:hypothetical protein